MISAEECLIELFANDAGLTAATGGRIANLHHYGQDSGDWLPRSAALTCARSGGAPQLYLKSDRAVYAVRCFGESPAASMAVYQAFAAYLRAFQRTAVTVTGGDGLVYYIIITSQPTVNYDEELDVYWYELVIEADVAEIAV